MPVLSRKLWKNLSQEQKEKRKESQRKWYAKPENKERKTMLNKKWCLENKEKRQESWRRYRYQEKNRTKINEKTKKWRQENRDIQCEDESQVSRQKNRTTSNRARKRLKCRPCEDRYGSLAARGKKRSPSVLVPKGSKVFVDQGRTRKQ